ncbi:hypothetical protein RI367_005144 [Sorochytrium milnesiophthora]
MELDSSCKDRQTVLHYHFNNTLVQHLQDWTAYFTSIDNPSSASFIGFGDASVYDAPVFDMLLASPFVQPQQVNLWQTLFNNTIRAPVNMQLNLSAVHTPVTFQYPPISNVSEMVDRQGVDFATDPVRRAAIDEAQSTGSMATALPVHLAHYNHSTLGLWTPPILQNASQLPLWVISAFIPLDTFFTTTLALMIEANVVHTRVFNSDTATGLPLYSEPVDDAIPLLQGEQTTLPLGIVDRHLTIECTATDELWKQFHSNWGTIAAIVINLIFLGIAAIVWRAIAKYERDRNDSQLLRESRKLLHALSLYSKIVVQAVPDPLLMLDSGGFVTGLNQHALLQTGYAAEDFSRSRIHITELIAFPVEFRFLPSGSWEVAVFRKDGSSFPAQCSVSPLAANRPADCVAQVMLLSDITAKKAALNELRQAEREARRANGVKTQLLYFICHELRNPLHVIRSASVLLSEMCVEQVVTEHIVPIMHASAYMTDLLGDIVEYVEQGTSGKMLVNMVSQASSPAPECDMTLSAIIDASANFTPFAAIQKSIRIELSGCETDEVLVQRNVRRVSKIVSKMLELGIRVATNPGNLTLTTDLRPPKDIDFPPSSSICDGSEADAEALPSIVDDPSRSLSDEQSPLPHLTVCLRLDIKESETTIPMEVDAFSFKQASLGKEFGGIGVASAVLYRLVARLQGSVEVYAGQETPSGTIVGQALIVTVKVYGILTIPEERPRQSTLDHNRVLSVPMEKIIMSFEAADKSKHPLSPSSSISRRLNAQSRIPSHVSLHQPASLERHPRQRQSSHASVGSTPAAQPTEQQAIQDNSPANGGASEAVAPVEVVEPAVPEAPKHILLVEDNMIVQRMTKKLLEKCDYKVATADNGQQAIDKVQSEDFSAVLMVRIMQCKLGFEATQHIRQTLGISRFKLPIIALTANALDEERNRCMLSGLFNNFLTKPASADLINQTIKQCIADASQGAPPAEG